MVGWVALALANLLPVRGAAEAPCAPFPEALERSEIEVPRLDSRLDYALILGNGDLNGLLFTEGGPLWLQVTKNDVWDARLDTSHDAPLPTIARIRELGALGGPIVEPILPAGETWTGPDSYQAKPYPCPRVCARVMIGEPPAPHWRPIRAEGAVNSWERRGDAAVMGIRGAVGASNGHSYAPLDVRTDRTDRLRVRLSGSPNARFFIDVMAPDGQSVLHTGWQQTPTGTEERVFELRAEAEATEVILYTWTVDGQPAENRFEELAFEGPAGSLGVPLDLTPAPTVAGKLDLRRAVAEARSMATVRALAQRNAFLIETQAPVRLEPERTLDTPPAEVGETRGVHWLRQTIPGDLDWPGMSFAVALAERGAQKAVAVVTSRETQDCLGAAVRLARRTANEPREQQIEAHEAEWQRYWAKSGVELDDPVLERTWYRSLYFLRCVTKPGVIAPGLFASLIDSAPAWHGDYHTNYNIQQTFWAAFPTNHPELAEPYDRLIRDYLPRAQWLAKRIFGLGGAYYPHVLYAYEPPDPVACRSRNGRQYIHHTWGMTLGVTGFTVQPLWWHYRYAPSRRLLEQTVYPPLRDAALFYADFLDDCARQPDRRFGPSVSPEHWGWTPGLERNYNGAFDSAYARYTLSAACEAARTLACDAALVACWEAALRQLPPYPTYGAEAPVVVDVGGAPPITYNISVPAVPVFPGDVVSRASPPEEQALFARTIEQLQWDGSNAMVMLGIARARLGLPGTQEWLRQEISARTRPNGTLTLNRLHQASLNDFGHYTEQFAAAMAISELIVQSVGGLVRVNAVLAPNATARFRNLRTEGGFLVSGEIADGETRELAIESTVGGALRLAGPDGVARYQTKPGQLTVIHPAPGGPGAASAELRAGRGR